MLHEKTRFAQKKTYKKGYSHSKAKKFFDATKKKGFIVYSQLNSTLKKMTAYWRCFLIFDMYLN